MKSSVVALLLTVAVVLVAAPHAADAQPAVTVYRTAR
jgi:hypothetical protein